MARIQNPGKTPATRCQVIQQIQAVGSGSRRPSGQEGIQGRDLQGPWTRR